MVRRPSLSSRKETDKSVFVDTPGSKVLLRQSNVIEEPFALVSGMILE